MYPALKRYFDIILTIIYLIFLNYNDIWIQSAAPCRQNRTGLSCFRAFIKNCHRNAVVSSRSLDLLVKNDKELRSINLSRSKDARNILEMAINSSDAKAKKIAVDLIHFLGAKGYFGYSDLIS